MRAHPTRKPGLTAYVSPRADSLRPAFAHLPLAPRHRYPAPAPGTAPLALSQRNAGARYVPCGAACTAAQPKLSNSARRGMYTRTARPSLCRRSALSLFPLSSLASKHGLFSTAFSAHRIPPAFSRIQSPDSADIFFWHCIYTILHSCIPHIHILALTDTRTVHCTDERIVL